MNQTLQILQFVLFVIPVVALITLGGVILLKPVSVVNRRWYLAVFLPILFANSLILLESILLNAGGGLTIWRFWLILLVDVFLIVGVSWYFRGFMVFGLNAADTETILKDALLSKGYVVQQQVGKKSILWGKPWAAQILTVNTNGSTEDIWITERFNEVLVRVDSSKGLNILKGGLPSLRKVERPYTFEAHAFGLLFLVVAVVLGVLIWIFFFEPQLLILD